MTDDASKKQTPTAPVQEPQADAPRSGSGADTALDAMIKKREPRAGGEPTLPGDSRTRPPSK
jgi:hypothetical protein